ncbi:transposase [Saccharicrinis sp. 156]|uniref:transposase n=1 Tax=Saccharicrinis sp. 156 TaxID=3417574 RepID=UPI003D32C96F
MDFQTGHLYHIYNQGNNKNNIFFNRDNYRFFLKKIATNILPFCDILAWCLMPNHFHLMVLVNSLEAELAYYTPGATSNSKCDSTTPGATRSRTRSEKTRTDTLQKSLGIMLASYTRASISSNML